MNDPTSQRICQRCRETDISHRPRRAKYCEPCAVKTRNQRRAERRKRQRAERLAEAVKQRPIAVDPRTKSEASYARQVFLAHYSDSRAPCVTCKKTMRFRLLPTGTYYCPVCNTTLIPKKLGFLGEVDLSLETWFKAYEGRTGPRPDPRESRILSTESDWGQPTNAAVAEGAGI